MWTLFSVFLAFVAILSSSIANVDARVQRGLAWATDSRYAPKMNSKPHITWYYHWQDGPISALWIEYVPQFWGPKYWSKWNERKAQMNAHLPQHLLAFNEPDISSQANMNPYYAADLYMQEINPWGRRGVKLGSPAIAWKLDWMATFLSEVQKKGGHVDFLVLHWYGSWNDLATFKRYVSAAHARFGKDIWITEFGITSASYPSQWQVKNFMMQAFAWMDAQGYVARAVWFGCFESNHPPDYYATGKNALLAPGGSPNDMGSWYSYTTYPTKRSHHQIARAVNESSTPDQNDDGEDTTYAVHCDEICQLRNTQLGARDAEELEDLA